MQASGAVMPDGQAGALAPARTCPHCAGLATRPLERYSTAQWHVVACAACGFVYLGNPPDYAALEEDLAWEKTSAMETERRAQRRPVLARLELQTRWRHGLFRKPRSEFYATLFPVGRVLDVGCGSSISVAEPYIPYGIEISRALYEAVAPRMAERGGSAVHGPAAEAIASFPDGFFSGVILRSVVEHEMNPATLLSHTARVLQADGAAYLRVPNFGSINRRVAGADWCGFRHPDHVNYFTLDSLGRMVAGAGLSMTLLHPLSLPFDDNLNVVLKHAA